jgi:hypothetical protein
MAFDTALRPVSHEMRSCISMSDKFRSSNTSRSHALRYARKEGYESHDLRHSSPSALACRKVVL